MSSIYSAGASVRCFGNSSIAEIAAYIGICITIAVIYFLNIGELRDTVDYENYDRKDICAGSNNDYEGRKYEDVVDELEALGFKNVQAKPLHDAIPRVSYFIEFKQNIYCNPRSVHTNLPIEFRGHRRKGRQGHLLLREYVRI
jgi:hypothetical protein